MIAKLVNIAPITMAYDTFISFYKCIFHGVSKPTHTSMATNSKLKSGMQNARGPRVPSLQIEDITSEPGKRDMLVSITLMSKISVDANTCICTVHFHASYTVYSCMCKCRVHVR